MLCGAKTCPRGRFFKLYFRLPQSCLLHDCSYHARIVTKTARVPRVKRLKTVIRVVVQTIECLYVCVWLLSKIENRPRVCQRVLVWVSCGALIPLVFLLCSCSARTSVYLCFNSNRVLCDIVRLLHEHNKTAKRQQEDNFLTFFFFFFFFFFFCQRLLNRAPKIRGHYFW